MECWEAQLKTNPELLVVIPYYNRQDTIKRAVNSVLSQTHENLQLLIVDDASDVPARDVIEPDPRIKFFDMKRNVGRYFIDAVASRANPFTYYMPHDSDDESVPHRLGVLKDKMHTESLDAVFNLERRVDFDGTEIVMPADPFHEPLHNERMIHRVHHSALYNNEALLNSGGYHPGFRTTYDTFVVNALKMVAKIGIVEEPLYIRHKTENSLTTSVETGYASPYRKRTKNKLTAMYLRCLDDPTQTKTIIEDSIAQKPRARMNAEIRRMKNEMGWS